LVLVQNLANHAELPAAPGEREAFTNSRYLLLAAMVELISKKTKQDTWEDPLSAPTIRGLAVFRPGFIRVGSDRSH